MADLLLKNISKAFNGHTVIEGLDLQIDSGEFVTLLGPSGCGKTTVLRMIAGLESIDRGELYIGGKRYNAIAAQKRPIAMVFQSYALFPHMSVKDNILFGLKIKKVDVSQRAQKLAWVLELLALQGLDKRLPKEISGGQRQRVALARALVLDPQVLLLDEPLSNLDAALRDMAMEELKRIHRQVGKTIIYVTHNQTEAMVMSERMVVLKGGRVEQYDTPMRVYDEPATLFSAEFIGSPPMNHFEGEIAARGNEVGVQTCAGFWCLDKERAVAAGRFPGRKVRIGVRPQNVNSALDVSGRRSSDTGMEVVIDLIEPLGDRSLVVGRTAQQCIVRFLVSRDETISVDQRMTVFVDGRKIHLFDPQTGVNLFHKADERI
jgi:ABC-type sugar transport system ATPase subunit